MARALRQNLDQALWGTDQLDGFEKRNITVIHHLSAAFGYGPASRRDTLSAGSVLLGELRGQATPPGFVQRGHFGWELTPTLIFPEILEPGRRQLGVPDGVPNVAVAQIGLNGPGIVSLTGQIIAGGMA
jgi:hypothetical protein